MLTTLLFATLAGLLLAACVFDLKSRTIPNWLNLSAALLAIPFWWASGLDPWPGMAVQLGVGLAVFALFALVFAAGQMGGGDVKLIAAVALWLPWQAVITLLALMSIAGGVLTLVMVIHRKLKRRQDPVEVPYGVAIAFGGLWLISERFLYQFAG